MLSAFSVSCDSVIQHNTETATEDMEASATESNDENIRYTYVIKYKELSFASNEQKQAWRSDLLQLIENEGTVRYEDESYAGYDFPYPDRPGIKRGYYLGLFDIDIDGTPELLVDMGGGSAGNSFYDVYSIKSGERLGSINGGADNSWCIYFNTKTGKYEAVGQFEWRMGWMNKLRFINKAVIADNSFGSCILNEWEYLFSSYSLDALHLVPTEERNDPNIEYIWEDICTGADFFINGSKVNANEYFAEYDDFLITTVRIPETAIHLIRRSEYDTAEEIVDALLSLNQKFISTND